MTATDFIKSLSDTLSTHQTTAAIRFLTLIVPPTTNEALRAFHPIQPQGQYIFYPTVTALAFFVLAGVIRTYTLLGTNAFVLNQLMADMLTTLLKGEALANPINFLRLLHLIERHIFVVMAFIAGEQFVAQISAMQEIKYLTIPSRNGRRPITDIESRYIQWLVVDFFTWGLARQFVRPPVESA